jgi:predicted short-subunit dehydrogenase-like oxidoreductase (DUF2520 family)
MKKKIVFIGAGNIATRLATEFYNKGNEILYIYSKNINSAKIMANEVKSKYTDDLRSIPSNVDLYFLVIPDQFVEEHINNINVGNGIVIHCSGSLNIDIFKGKVKNYGVFYPLQTFSKSRLISFSHVPVCIESHDPLILELLNELGNQISGDVRQIDTDARLILHLAAVFVCNFVNHMYSVADDILETNHLPIEILYPLMEETLKKARLSKPQNAQTGPAKRQDKNIINKHLELLSYSQDFYDLYKTITNSISTYGSR